MFMLFIYVYVVYICFLGYIVEVLKCLQMKLCGFMADTDLKGDLGGLFPI